MNALQNEIRLIGRVGSDVESKTLENGVKVAKVSLATNHSYTKKTGEKVNDTDWHRLEAWGSIADRMDRYVVKGNQLAVSGRLTYDEWETKEGVKVRAAVIRISEVLFLTPQNK